MIISGIKSMTLSLALLAFILLSISGCAIRPTKNITEQTALKQNEGILIINIRTNVKQCSMLIHGKKDKYPSALLESVQGPEDLRVIPIKSGDAHISKIATKDQYGWRSPEYFHIEPGTINYVGDFVLEWLIVDGALTTNSLIIDREPETIKKAKMKYPWIFEKLPYRKNIPKREKKNSPPVEN